MSLVFSVKKIVLISFLLCITQLKAQVSNWPQLISKSDLVWSQIDSSFYNGAYIGDGIQGAMIMRDSKNPDGVRMLMGHYKAIAHYSVSGWEYANSRVYAGNIIVDPAGKALSQNMRMGVFDGETTGSIITDKGSLSWSAIADRKHLVFVVKMNSDEGEAAAELKVREEWGISPRYYLDKKNLADYANHLPPKPELSVEGGINLVVNKMKQRGAHVVASKLVTVNNQKILYVAIGVDDYSNTSEAAARAKIDAVNRVNAAVAEGYDVIKNRNTAWWNDYMLKSKVSIEDDPYWQKFWYLQMYKFGCASSENSDFLIDTQGPWIWETAWAGVWWNLNVQLSYFPVYSGNRLDAGSSLIKGMDRLYNSGVLHSNATSAGGSGGIYIARSSTYEGRASWGDEFGNLPWVLHCYWKHWKYSGDDNIGAKLFPMLKDNLTFLMSKMEKQADGKYHMKPSRSPEYDDAILYPDANYSLMSVHWVVKTLIEMNSYFGYNDPKLSQWTEVLTNLVPFPTNANGFMVSSNQGFDKGHRHYSHLMSIYPYHTTTPDENRDLVQKSVNRWLTLTEVSGHSGYTYTGGCAMLATLGDGQNALRVLDKLKATKLTPNLMYAEGGGPVIETPLSGVESINYMLLQSWNGIVRIFPAVPSRWKQLRFEDLRAEGAFLVSATYNNGRIENVTLLSEKGKACTVLNPWADKALIVKDEAGVRQLLTKNGNNYTFATQAGKTYYLSYAKAPVIKSGKIVANPKAITLKLTEPLAGQAPFTGFEIKKNASQAIAIQSQVYSAIDTTLTLTMGADFANTDEVTLSYSAGNVMSMDNIPLANISFFTIDNLLTGSAPRLLGAVTNADGSEILLTFNKSILNPQSNPFVLTKSTNTTVTVSAIGLKANAPNIVVLTLSANVYLEDVLNLSYAGTSIQSVDNGQLKPITAFEITNLSKGAPPVVKSATALISGDVVELEFDKIMLDASQQISYLSLKANGVNVPILNLSFSGKMLTITTSVLMEQDQSLTLSYNVGGNIVAADGGVLTYFADYPVVNNVVTKYIKEFSINNAYPTFSIEIAEKDKVVYNDRGFIFPTLPESINKTEYIRWANNMKSTNLNLIASFKTSADGRVYIAHDNRIQKPDWLKNNYTVTTTQFLINDAMMTLYYKDVTNNTVVELGSNQIPGTETGACTHYVVFFRKTPSSTDVEIANENTVKVFPMLAKDFINVTLGEIHVGSIQVYSVMGTLVFQKDIVGDSYQIPVSNWEQGMYLVKVVLPDFAISKKVLVVN